MIAGESWKSRLNEYVGRSFAEAGATITTGRYAAFGFDGGNVSVTNYATVIGATAAIAATTRVNWHRQHRQSRNLIGVVTSYNAVFTNEAAAS
jgi:hypothetical protein